MPEIDFSAAYRDAAKGSTIKALQQRRAEAQAAIQAAQQPRQIASPWQGAAQIGEVISGSIREGRLANQEAASRQRFAQLLAGGLAPDEAGEALSLDHETAMQFIQRNWASEDAKEKAKLEEANTLRSHGWDVAAQTKAVEDARETARQAREGAAGIDKEKVAAAAKAGQLDIISGDEAVKRDPSLDPKRTYAVSADGTSFTDITPDTPESYGPLQTGTELGLGGKAGEQLFQTSLTTNKTGQVGGAGTNVTTNVGGGSKLDETLATEEGKIWSGFQKARNVAAGSQADFQVLGELTKIAPQGPIIGNLAKLPVLRNFSNAGQAFNAMVKRIAPTLHVSGTGAQSDIEYQGMLDSLGDLGNYPEANNMIFSVMQAKAQIDIERGNVVDQYRNQEISEVQARQKLNEIDSRKIMPPELGTLLLKLKEGGGGAGVPVFGGGDTAAPPAAGGAATPPPVAGGTEAGAPTMQPRDVEGDTGTDDAGNKWIVRGGSWVRQ